MQDEQLSKVAAAIAALPLRKDIEIDIEQRAERLLLFCSMALLEDLPMASPSRAKDGTRVEVQKLAELLTQLHKHIAAMHSDSRTAVDRQSARHGIKKDGQTAVHLTALQWDVERMILAARRAIQEIPHKPEKKGRGGKPGAAAVAEICVGVFADLTGGKAGRGFREDTSVATSSFLTFLAAVFDALGIVASADATAKAAIKKVKEQGGVHVKGGVINYRFTPSAGAKPPKS